MHPVRCVDSLVGCRYGARKHSHSSSNRPCCALYTRHNMMRGTGASLALRCPPLRCMPPAAVSASTSCGSVAYPLIWASTLRHLSLSRIESAERERGNSHGVHERQNVFTVSPPRLCASWSSSCWHLSCWDIRCHMHSACMFFVGCSTS